MSSQSSPVKPARPAASETDDDDDKQDTLIKHVDIAVVESEKRANGTLHVRDHYTVYLIDVKVTDAQFVRVRARASVWRRYTEFEQLHDYLQLSYPHAVVPPLPEKRVQFGWRGGDTTEPEFVERRRAGLDNFLLRVASHRALCYDDLLLAFLQRERGWRETLTDTGYMLQAENKLKALSVSIRLKKPDPEIEGVKNYGKQLETNLANFLYTRSKIMEKNYALCKLHAQFGKLFSEWSVIEQGMGDGLQRAGHYCDSIADSVDAVAEDEEQLADQLKEYLFYAGALQHTCRNHEALQRALELAHHTLDNRRAERARAAAGRAGLLARLFGATEPDIARDRACRALDARLLADRRAVEHARDHLQQFGAACSLEAARFRRQERRDLHETLVAFIALQARAARKNLQAWTQIQECLHSMP